jgi:hypothetical protein
MARSESFTTGRIHCRRPLLLIRTFCLQSGGGPYIARRACRCDPLPRLETIRGREPSLSRGGVHALKARSESLAGESASEGRGVISGTLNANRKASGNGDECSTSSCVSAAIAEVARSQQDVEFRNYLAGMKGPKTAPLERLSVRP